MPECDVVNFGVVGYSTVQSLIQFREALARRPPPTIVVVGYLRSIHDPKNTLSRNRRKFIIDIGFGSLVYPYARIDASGGLRIASERPEFREFPGMRHSAVIHALERGYDQIEEDLPESHRVTEGILKEFQKLCGENHARLIVADLESSAGGATCRGSVPRMGSGRSTSRFDPRGGEFWTRVTPTPTPRARRSMRIS